MIQRRAKRVSHDLVTPVFLVLQKEEILGSQKQNFKCNKQYITFQGHMFHLSALLCNQVTQLVK